MAPDMFFQSETPLFIPYVAKNKLKGSTQLAIN